MITALRLRRGTLTSTLSLVVALVFAMSCGNCGGSTSSSSGSPNGNLSVKSSPSIIGRATNITLPADICTLVTADEASAAVGVTVTNLAAQGGVAIPGACFYGSQSDSSAGVLLFAQAYPDAATADQTNPEQMAAAFRAIYGINNAKVVTGIGDKAVEYGATGASSGSAGIAIFVFKSNILLFIIMTPTTDSTKVEGLARTAVGRLH